MGDNDNSLREKKEFYKKKGNEEYNKKNFSDAIHFYTEGIIVKCSDKELQSKLYSNRAKAHLHLGNYEQSLSDATAATDLQPTFLKAIERGANACMKMDRVEEAITWCDKGLAIDNNNKKLLELKLQCLEEQNKQRATEKSQTETIKRTVSTFSQAAEEELMHRNLGHSCLRLRF
ncbi:tetratricopeptide repeat protein 4-like [Oculina patagonica]